MIDQESISFEAIEQDFLDYLSDLPEDYAWKDRYEDSIGQTLVELLAGFGSLLGTRILLTRREAFLSTALLRSSVQGIAGSNLGYSAYRGRNPHIKLTVTASDGVSLDKFQVVGTYGQYDVVMAEDQTINPGSNEVEVIVGDAKEAPQIIQTTSPTTFRFYAEKVSEDYLLEVDGVVVPTSDEFKDLNDDYYLVLTNYLSSVDVAYLNDGEYNYNIASVMALTYVERATIGAVNLASVMFDYGVITASELLYADVPADTLDLIRIKAPLYHETQSMVRGREDYEKVALDLIEGGKDVKGRDVTAAVIQLVYVKEDGTLMNSGEKENLIDLLEPYRLFGVSPPTIIDPTEIEIPLDITARLLANSTLTVSEIEDGIDETLLDYTKILGVVFDTTDLEYALERLEGLKYARVEVASGCPIVASGTLLSLDWDEYASFTYDLVVS